MAYKPVILHQFEKKFKKYTSKDRGLREQVLKKIAEIVANPEIGEPKRHFLKGYRAEHVDPFVIFYTVIEDRVVLVYFEHHDKVYRDANSFAPALLAELKTCRALDDVGLSTAQFMDFVELIT